MITREVEPGDWAQSARAALGEGYTFFDWLAAVDQGDQEENPGLDLLCHLIRLRPWDRLLLRTRVPDGTAVASLTGVFAGAAWHEREAHEMFGLQISGFEDGTGAGLRPLLLPDGFEGTPLRKSFVLTARASKPWPGAKEPGESDSGAVRRSPSRRRLLPPGVPDPSWGPR